MQFVSQFITHNTQMSKFTIELVLYPQTIGPLQLAIHVIQNRHAGEQKSRWDGMPFVCLVPVRLLFSSMAVLYHVNC